MAALKEASALLPNGEYFDLWETEQVYDRELHVSAAVAESGDGSAGKPFKTISEAAAIAEPGTRVLIHGGTYRETVKPAKGGESPEKMISYEAFGDGEAIIKASVVQNDFFRCNVRLYSMDPAMGKTQIGEPVIWGTRLNPEDFKGYNPFCAMNIMHDRYFMEYEKTDMTTYLQRRGMIFVDGKPLFQVSGMAEMATYPGSFWVEANGQIVLFRLADDGDPNDHVIELASREQCFAPDIPGLQYIKVKGLTCAHAATGAPFPQRGSISMSGGTHWIIEDCVIDWSNGVGIDIGRGGVTDYSNPASTIRRPCGYAIIRRNKIYNVGVTGIAGAGASYSLIEDNLIEGTGWQKMELSWEAGAIKTHNSVDCLFRRNIFTKTFRADHLWMDVGNRNNRITQNLFLDGIEQREAIFVECTRDDVNLFDNNIIWNVEGRFNEADVKYISGSATWYNLSEDGSIINGYGIYGEGTDYLRISNNLIGKCRSAGYFQKTVAFRLAGRGGTARDAKIYNNIFYDCGEAAIKFPTEKNDAQGNCYMKMPSGFLRILYPAPTECLDLKAWRNFHGFDLEGSEADFIIDIDTDNFTMTILPPDPNADMAMIRRRFMNAEEYIHDPNALPKVKADPKATIDFFGNETPDETRAAGPFTELPERVVINIDPRKLN